MLMNEQNIALVKEQIHHTLARLSQTSPSEAPLPEDPSLAVSIINTGILTGTINVASRSPLLRDESAQPQPAPQLAPQPAPQPVPQPAWSPVQDRNHRHDHEFRSTFHSFRHDLKWKLPSGSAVEDVLFREKFTPGVSEEVRKSIRHWTVLVDNDEMPRMFDTQDWQAIQAKVKPLPCLSDPTLHFLQQFLAVCI